MKNWYRLQLLFVTFQLYCEVTGQSAGEQHMLEVQAHTYRNSASQIANGQCCETRGNRCITSGCCNFFQFCLRTAGTSLNNRTCPFGLVEFFVGSRDDNIITFNTGSSILENVPVPNPLVYGLQSVPAEGFQLVVLVIDRDMDRNDPEDQFVDRFVIEPANIQPSSSFSNSVIYSGDFQGSTVQLELSFRLRCGRNYYGLNCETLCIPQDNDSGHYACDESGNIVCLAGYTGTETNCITCIPAQGCVTNQGFCNQPGECICHPGFTGDLCETETTAGSSIVISANGSTTNTTDSSTIGGPNQQGSGGQAAAIVIPILVVLALLAAAGVVIGLLYYRYRPFKAKYYVNKQTKGSLENPTYEIQTNTSNVVLAHISPVNGHQMNGRAQHNTGRSLDYDDPLYSSTAVDDTDGASHHTYDTVEGRVFDSPLYESTATNTLPTPRQSKEFLTVRDRSQSRSMENLLTVPQHSSPSKVNPYGEYGDKTLQRVASNFSVNDLEGGSGQQVFDNPDYEDVQIDTECDDAVAVSSDYPSKNTRVNDKDQDYDDIDDY